MILSRIMARLARPKQEIHNWDRNSFQGKRKDQVNYAAMSTTIAVLGMILLLILILIDSLWK